MVEWRNDAQYIDMHAFSWMRDISELYVNCMISLVFRRLSNNVARLF